MFLEIIENLQQYMTTEEIIIISIVGLLQGLGVSYGVKMLLEYLTGREAPFFLILFISIPIIIHL